MKWSCKQIEHMDHLIGSNICIYLLERFMRFFCCSSYQYRVFMLYGFQQRSNFSFKVWLRCNFYPIPGKYSNFVDSLICVLYNKDICFPEMPKPAWFLLKSISSFGFHWFHHFLWTCFVSIVLSLVQNRIPLVASMDCGYFQWCGPYWCTLICSYLL